MQTHTHTQPNPHSMHTYTQTHTHTQTTLAHTLDSSSWTFLCFLHFHIGSSWIIHLDPSVWLNVMTFCLYPWPCVCMCVRESVGERERVVKYTTNPVDEKIINVNILWEMNRPLQVCAREEESRGKVVGCREKGRETELFSQSTASDQSCFTRSRQHSCCVWVIVSLVIKAGNDPACLWALAQDSAHPSVWDETLHVLPLISGQRIQGFPSDLPPPLSFPINRKQSFLNLYKAHEWMNEWMKGFVAC